ncbi:MAG: AzlD domain-containing protein [Vicinamibacterales bacterium]
MRLWGLFVTAGVGTYLIRASAILAVGHGLVIPAGLERTLRLIAPAVLAAISANGLLLDQGAFNTRASWYAGAALAIWIVARWRSASWGMAGAMALVWLLQQAGIR